MTKIIKVKVSWDGSEQYYQEPTESIWKSNRLVTNVRHTEEKREIQSTINEDLSAKKFNLNESIQALLYNSKSREIQPQGYNLSILEQGNHPTGQITQIFNQYDENQKQ